MEVKDDVQQRFYCHKVSQTCECIILNTLVIIFYIIKIKHFVKPEDIWGHAFVHSDINIQLSSTACWNASFLDQRFENYISVETLAVLESMLCFLLKYFT